MAASSLRSDYPPGRSDTVHCVVWQLDLVPMVLLLCWLSVIVVCYVTVSSIVYYALFHRKQRRLYQFKLKFNRRRLQHMSASDSFTSRVKAATSLRSLELVQKRYVLWRCGHWTRFLFIVVALSDMLLEIGSTALVVNGPAIVNARRSDSQHTHAFAIANKYLLTNHRACVSFLTVSCQTNARIRFNAYLTSNLLFALFSWSKVALVFSSMTSPSTSSVVKKCKADRSSTIMGKVRMGSGLLANGSHLHSYTLSKCLLAFILSTYTCLFVLGNYYLTTHRYSNGMCTLQVSGVLLYAYVILDVILSVTLILLFVEPLFSEQSRFRRQLLSANDLKNTANSNHYYGNGTAAMSGISLPPPPSQLAAVRRQEYEMRETSCGRRIGQLLKHYVCGIFCCCFCFCRRSQSAFFGQKGAGLFLLDKSSTYVSRFEEAPSNTTPSARRSSLLVAGMGAANQTPAGRMATVKTTTAISTAAMRASVLTPITSKSKGAMHKNAIDTVNTIESESLRTQSIISPQTTDDFVSGSVEDYAVASDVAIANESEEDEFGSFDRDEGFVFEASEFLTRKTPRLKDQRYTRYFQTSSVRSKVKADFKLPRAVLQTTRTMDSESLATARITRNVAGAPLRQSLLPRKSKSKSTKSSMTLTSMSTTATTTATMTTTPSTPSVEYPTVNAFTATRLPQPPAFGHWSDFQSPDLNSAMEWVPPNTLDIDGDTDCDSDLLSGLQVADCSELLITSEALAVLREEAVDARSGRSLAEDRVNEGAFHGRVPKDEYYAAIGSSDFSELSPSTLSSANEVPIHESLVSKWRLSAAGCGRMRALALAKRSADAAAARQCASGGQRWDSLRTDASGVPLNSWQRSETVMRELEDAIRRNTVAGSLAVLISATFLATFVASTQWKGDDQLRARLWAQGFAILCNFVRYIVLYAAMTLTYRDWRAMLTPGVYKGLYALGADYCCAQPTDTAQLATSKLSLFSSFSSLTQDSEERHQQIF